MESASSGALARVCQCLAAHARSLVGLAAHLLEGLRRVALFKSDKPDEIVTSLKCRVQGGPSICRGKSLIQLSCRIECKEQVHLAVIPVRVQRGRHRRCNREDIDGLVGVARDQLQVSDPRVNASAFPGSMASACRA